MAPEVQLMQRSSTRWRTFAFTMMALALLGASCDGGDDGEAIGAGGDSSTTSAIETTTSAPPATTTTAVPTPEEVVLAAYHGYWAAIDEALGLPQAQPGLAALRQYGTGESLAGIVESAETLLVP